MKNIITFFLVFTSVCFAQYSNWEYYGNMRRPVAGGEIWENQNNEILFILGGYSDSIQAKVNWIQAFTPNWELDSMSTPRYGFVTENYSDQVIFFGGVHDDLSFTSGIERWGIDFNDEAFLSYNTNFNRIFSTGQIIGENLYIIGGNPLPGTSTDTLAYIVEYNLNQSEVTFTQDSVYMIKDLPAQQMSEIIGNDIFIFGGVINGISQDIFKFNILDQGYEKLTVQLGQPRAGGRAIKSSYEDKIYIIGGYNEIEPALNSVEIFSVYEDEYSIEEGHPIQEARYYFMSGKLADHFYIMGGFDSNGNVLESIELLREVEVTEIGNDLTKAITGNYQLNQNFPNPFNPTTTIKYEIPNQSYSDIYSAYTNVDDKIKVILTIYDILGNEVSSLINDYQYPGVHSLVFDATNYPSGVYYYQLISGSFNQTKKMILLK